MIREILAAVSIGLGVICCVLSLYGVYRFDYVLTRIHAAAVVDTLGTLLIFIGMILLRGLGWASAKILLILANVIFGIFCIWFCFPMIQYIKLLKGFVLPVSRLPEAAFYWPIPFFMALTVIRLIQDSIRLAKENEQTLGETVPPLDMNAYERIAEARREAEAIAAAQEAEKKGAKK